MIRILAAVKILVEILWFSTEISWDSCPVNYLWSCFYYEFHYEMSVKCMIRILAIVKIMVKILWFSTEISWDPCPVHYLWSCFYYEFHYEMSIKCMIRILAIVKIMMEIYNSVLKYHETHVRFIIYEVFFTMNFTMKCLLSAWSGFWP